MTHVAVVHLGRPSARGEERRVRSLLELFGAAGATATVLPLTAHRPALREFPAAAVAVVRGHTVPETTAWSRDSLLGRLEDLAPALVICVTTRAFHPSLADRWPVLLDYVDRLSVSYAERSTIAGTRPLRAAYRVLAVPARRVERRRPPTVVAAVAAGWSDAEALGVEWLPILADPVPARESGGATGGGAWDVGFVGTLTYPPNTAAVERLGRLWPEILRRRPGTTGLVAGASPPAVVRHLATRHGWRLVADFADAAAVYDSVKVAVTPLDHASGMQIKVLDAAVHGATQVVSPRAAAGFDPDFPLVTAATDARFVDATVALLDDPAARRDAATAARQHAERHYTVSRWASWAERLLDAVAS